MAVKLDYNQKYILRLIKKDADEEGWAPVSEVLFNVLSENLPQELAVFEKSETGGRARLTQEGNNLLSAMEWL